MRLWKPFPTCSCFKDSPLGYLIVQQTRLPEDSAVDTHPRGPTEERTGVCLSPGDKATVSADGQPCERAGRSVRPRPARPQLALPRGVRWGTPSPRRLCVFCALHGSTSSLDSAGVFVRSFPDSAPVLPAPQNEPGMSRSAPFSGRLCLMEFTRETT